MEKIHARAVDALERFIHLANASSNTPRDITDIITNATSSPNTFIFAELLEVPAIQSLRSPDTPAEYRNHLTLLEIFAWGTWEEYQSTPNLPQLNDKQSEKLRLLSLLTLSTSHNPLTYAIAMKALSLPNHAALESLVTKAIYSSLITARISPATNPAFIHVTSTAPLRDVRPQSIAPMISILTEWQARCSDVVGGIETEIAKIKSDAEKRRAREKDRASRVERSVAGWDGDGDEDDGAGAGAGAGAGSSSGSGAGSKHSLSFSGGGRGPSLRSHFSAMAGGGGSGSKRELNDCGDDSRYRGFGRMDVDGPGMGAGADGGLGGVGQTTRHAKRLLALGSR
ncbi:COP9 signalosome complex subunit [Histoplasma capsulatum G186AR]|uniref:COP9 signalosome complex subunit n=2 Tax=Ajellomyces capsulatus TaxID=5037 RepID=C0NN05_AJECG|nr:COP9 signalosome complex subunit [Histoplasma capsulatum G186AR]EEH07253.1 COP9 signalosome complex subunit [Histoplasma capsulatum G186AR]KAG5304622.1 COP9 signalosome complex subunit [Histoplasma capsulatum]QSS70220.1 COP9 signalosome complex subunit [Histoplasma capsulatum G186AR]